MDTAPVVFVDADEDDQFLFKQALIELGVERTIVAFSDGQSVLDYLNNTSEEPFLILSEISMPGMSGLELRHRIEEDNKLRRKSIPFVFITAPVEDHLIDEAYELTIQGLFEKKQSQSAFKKQLRSIIDYWTECEHPKRSQHNK